MAPPPPLMTRRSSWRLWLALACGLAIGCEDAPTTSAPPPEPPKTLTLETPGLRLFQLGRQAPLEPVASSDQIPSWSRHVVGIYHPHLPGERDGELLYRLVDLDALPSAQAPLAPELVGRDELEARRGAAFDAHFLGQSLYDHALGHTDRIEEERAHTERARALEADVVCFERASAHLRTLCLIRPGALEGFDEEVLPERAHGALLVPTSQVVFWAPLDEPRERGAWTQLPLLGQREDDGAPQDSSPAPEQEPDAHAPRDRDALVLGGAGAPQAMIVCAQHEEPYSLDPVSQQRRDELLSRLPPKIAPASELVARSVRMLSIERVEGEEITLAHMRHFGEQRILMRRRAGADFRPVTIKETQLVSPPPGLEGSGGSTESVRWVASQLSDGSVLYDNVGDPREVIRKELPPSRWAPRRGLTPRALAPVPEQERRRLAEALLARYISVEDMTSLCAALKASR